MSPLRTDIQAPATDSAVLGAPSSWSWTRRQLGDPAVLRLDLPGDAARLLSGEVGVVERLPLVHERARRILLEDRDVTSIPKAEICVVTREVSECPGLGEPGWT